MKNFKDMLVISDEVLNALTSCKPIVALESTIISHGMPNPVNIQTALEVEEIVKKTGAVPASISIIKGKIHIGLTEKDFDYLGSAKNVFKASSADLPVVIAKNLTASTTVSASISLAYLVGIKFFVTGGIGGVHRHAENTFDISTDLHELSKTPVTVICAGPKAILDIPKTLEYLETSSVPLICYKSDFVPAFYSAVSPYKALHKVETVRELADIVVNRELLKQTNSILIANPVPQEFSLDFFEIEKKINLAIELATKNNITGKDLTPFLLNNIKELTENKSLEANIALIKNNAKLGAELAVEYTR